MRKFFGYALLPCGILAMALSLMPARWIGGGEAQMVLFLLAASVITGGIAHIYNYPGPHLSFTDSGADVDQNMVGRKQLLWEDIDFVTPGASAILMSTWSDVIRIPLSNPRADELLRLARGHGIPDNYDHILSNVGLMRVEESIAAGIAARGANRRATSQTVLAPVKNVTEIVGANSGASPAVAGSIAFDRYLEELLKSPPRNGWDSYLRRLLGRKPDHSIKRKIATAVWVLVGVLLPTVGFGLFGFLSKTGLRGDWKVIPSSLFGLSVGMGMHAYRDHWPKRQYPRVSITPAGIAIAYSAHQLVEAPWNRISLYYQSPRRLMIVFSDRLMTIPRSAAEYPEVVDALQAHGIEDLFSPRLQAEGIERADAFIDNDDCAGAGRVISEIARIPESAAVTLVALGMSDMKREAAAAA